ncbi:hypothetical protein [Paraburkholderia kirstenboschensis]|uniref:hypothetical protein n=1 Tax=Paraburkholderia kirstenboschensis TaxID=1245436 RepID=UPI001FB49B2D|nr:hypothetical protein [Paraburkholderia kirstenboschensis]
MTRRFRFLQALQRQLVEQTQHDLLPEFRIGCAAYAHLMIAETDGSLSDIRTGDYAVLSNAEHVPLIHGHSQHRESLDGFRVRREVTAQVFGLTQCGTYVLRGREKGMNARIAGPCCSSRLARGGDLRSEPLDVAHGFSQRWQQTRLKVPRETQRRTHTDDALHHFLHLLVIASIVVTRAVQQPRQHAHRRLLAHFLSLVAFRKNLRTDQVFFQYMLWMRDCNVLKELGFTSLKVSNAPGREPAPGSR